MTFKDSAGPDVCLRLPPIFDPLCWTGVSGLADKQPAKAFRMEDA